MVRVILMVLEVLVLPLVPVARQRPKVLQLLADPDFQLVQKHRLVLMIQLIQVFRDSRLVREIQMVLLGLCCLLIHLTQ